MVFEQFFVLQFFSNSLVSKKMTQNFFIFPYPNIIKIIPWTREINEKNGCNRIAKKCTFFRRLQQLSVALRYVVVVVLVAILTTTHVGNCHVVI